MFSTGIITKNNHVGLTLLKFWQENLLIEFKNRKYGRQIWRTEGGRNRYTSEVCNRSPRFLFYREYAEELLAAADEETMLRQIRQFQRFLLERRFSYDAFKQKLPGYLVLLEKEDTALSEEGKAFLWKAWEAHARFDGQSDVERAFYCSWILTFLMFHAAVGNGESEELLQQLRNNPGLSLETMEEAREENREERMEKSDRKAVYLTGRNTELCTVPLGIHHFFGRERELFELREMLKHSGKYLVSGIGGIGKTELLRQFLKCCENEKLVDCICTVQYEGSLAESFVRAFPQIQDSNAENKFKETLARIRIQEGKKVLVVIDNMNRTVQEDADIALLDSLPATIFVTSRCQKMEGFQTYRIPAIGKEAGALIFRDNYARPLAEQEMQILEKILNTELWRHTLTMRLLGRAAHSRGWTVEELKQRLERKEVFWDRQDGYGSLKQMYRQLYASANMGEQLSALLEVFAALPYQSYPLSFAQQYLQGFLEKGQSMEESLERLFKEGWLERRDSGYSMHPFVAECILVRPLTEKEFLPFFESVIAAGAQEKEGFEIGNIECFFETGQYVGQPLSKELKEVLLAVNAAAMRLSGEFSERLQRLLLLGLLWEYRLTGERKQTGERVKALYTRCRKVSASTGMCREMLGYMTGTGSLEETEKEYLWLQDAKETSVCLRNAFLSELATGYQEAGKQERAKEIAEELLTKGVNMEQKLLAHFLLSICFIQQGKFVEATAQLETGNRLANQHHIRDYLVYKLEAQAAEIYVAMGQFEKAGELLEQAEQQTAEQAETAEFRFAVLFHKGIIAAQQGLPGFGIRELEESRTLAKALFMADSINYEQPTVQLAMAYNKAGQRERACELYREGLDILEKLSGFAYEKHRVWNNLAVVYLDWEKPDEALSYLELAYEQGILMGGLAAAEPANNLSKAWRMLGNREKELHYLKEALPVLEQFYGSDAPKVTDAMRRLAEEKD